MLRSEERSGSVAAMRYAYLLRVIPYSPVVYKQAAYRSKVAKATPTNTYPAIWQCAIIIALLCAKWLKVRSLALV